MTLLILLCLWLLLLALVANVLRRLPWLPGVVTAAGLAGLAWQLWRLPATGATSLFGRAIDLDQSNAFFGFTVGLGLDARAAMLVLLAGSAVLALIAVGTAADRVLFPAIPLVLSALVLALSSTPLLWAPLWLVVASILMAFPAQGASPRLARAALRTLVAPFLALPFFLFAAWVLAQPTLAADDPALWNTAWRGLVIGLGILLTPVPLHGWLTALGEHAPPFAAAFIAHAWQLTVYALIRRVLLTYPLLADYADPSQWLPWLAVIQMLWAGLFALGSNRLGQFWGYLLLWDAGATYLLWGLSGEFGTQAMLWLLLARPLLLATVAAGVQTLQQRFDENTGYQLLAGASERLPIASLCLVAGSLGLLGWPPAALFAARLTTWRLAEATQTSYFLAAMPALALMMVGIIRLLRALTQPLPDVRLKREPAALFWLVLPLFLAGALLALYPSLLDPLTLRLADWMTHLP